MGGGIYDGTYSLSDPFMRAAMEGEGTAGMFPCSKCQGSGSIVQWGGATSPCPRCNGAVRKLRGKYAGSGVSTERRRATHRGNDGYCPVCAAEPWMDHLQDDGRDDGCPVGIVIDQLRGDSDVS